MVLCTHLVLSEFPHLNFSIFHLHLTHQNAFQSINIPVIRYSPSVTGTTQMPSLSSKPTFITAKSQFLELPLEVRRLIYSYLIPDNEVHVPQLESLKYRPAYRRDGSSCCPQMLRVNRKVYTEISLEWYSNATFGVSISEATRLNGEENQCYGVLSFLGAHFKSGAGLPCRLQQIKNLSLQFNLLKHSLIIPGSTCYGSRGQAYLDQLDALVSLLCAPESKLENLTLHVGTRLIVMGKMRRQPELNLEFMEARLHSLRKFRGLKEVEVHFYTHRPQLRELHIAQAPNLDIDAWIHEFLGFLRKEMMESKLP